MKVAMVPRSITDLPDEILGVIFSYLKAESLKQCSETLKR